MNYNLTDNEIQEIEKNSFSAYDTIKVVIDALKYRNKENDEKLNACIKLLKVTEQKIKEICLNF